MSWRSSDSIASTFRACAGRPCAPRRASSKRPTSPTSSRAASEKPLSPSLSPYFRISVTKAAIRSAAWASSAGAPEKTSHTVHLRARASSCRSEEHTSELQSRSELVCRLLLEKKKKNQQQKITTPKTKKNKKEKTKY